MINKSMMMKEAHGLKREHGLSMAEAMRRSWKIQKLTEAGGNRWQKNGFDRVYLSKKMICDMIGLEIATYKTGNICSASLDGEKISNSKAYKILDSMHKVWYDVTTGQAGVKGYSASAMADHAKDAVLAA